MVEKETIEEKHWKKYRRRRSNAILLVTYCALFVFMGAFLLAGGLSQKEMYNSLKDDEYLTDDSLAYRDMVNATYTYTVAEIDELASSSLWMTAMGAVVLVASAIVALVVAWIMPEKREIHSMLCKGDGVIEYCAECGLKLSKLKDD